MPAQYRLVFDLSTKPYQWWFPAVGLIFVAVGILAALAIRHYPSISPRRYVGHMLVVFGALWSIGAFAATYPHYYKVHSRYRHDEYSTVEGRIEHFKPMPYEGHTDECFSVLEKTFCYSDYSINPGFSNTSSHGGPIRAGLLVRVRYVEDEIVRIEIKSEPTDSSLWENHDSLIVCQSRSWPL